MLPPLNADILRTIFSLHCVDWTNPPWYVQHDLDIWNGQRALASYALVCRSWERASRPVLLRKPVLRLTYRNCLSFLCAIMRSKSSIVSFLGLFSLDSSVNFLTIRNLLNKVRGFAAPSHSLFFDNVPRSFFVYFDDWIIGPTVASFGVRCVDVVAGAVEQEPAKLMLPPLPSIRALFCCNVDLSDLFLSSVETVQHVSTLSVQYCFLSADALRALERFASLHTLFIGNMTFTPEFLSAFPLHVCDQLDWFGIYGLDVEEELIRQPWNDGISEMPVSFLEKVHEDLAATDPLGPSTSILSSNLARISKIWALHAGLLDESSEPPLIALAINVSTDLLLAFQQQMGFTPPVWSPYANPSTPAYDMVFTTTGWRGGYVGPIERYLTGVAGFRVHLLFDETLGKSFEETRGWGEAYIACNVRPVDLAIDLSEEHGKVPNDDGMGRVLSLVGPALSQPKTRVFGHMWNG